LRKFVFVRTGTKHPFEDERGGSEGVAADSRGARGMGVVTVDVVPGSVGGVGVEGWLITYKRQPGHRMSREEP